MKKRQVNKTTWNKIATLYEEVFMDLTLYNDTYDSFCANIKKTNPDILEIGCGPGNITKYLLNKRTDFNILGTDIAPNMISLAKKNNPAARFEIMDCRDIATLSTSYDGIICGFCIPYISKSDCQKLIKDTSTLLNKGGHFYLSILDGNHTNSDYQTGPTGDKVFLYYYSESFILNLLHECNFHQVKVFSIPFQNKRGEEQVHKIFIASRK